MTGQVRAVLGPTNTGKTHYAVERMLAHSTGIMGFPLRLLAREIYDRVVAAKGVNAAALITGEERIVPSGARYFLCTAEAMPRHKAVDFAALDEVQMAADPERGHVFTQHILHTRGRHETLLLGSETMRPVLTSLIPDLDVMTRPRMSELSYVKPVKLSRLPRRSAVVGFSTSDVYGMAELIRRNRGGAAIVMGALSPRTRNAQVELYQSGEVDFLVATDAIGMGLNMDIHHIAFASLSKFDGRSFRDLTAAEAAQIAGRAGRHTRDGTFSTLAGGDPFDGMMVTQIEDHKFTPVKKLVWRNPKLDFNSVGRLIRSLEERTYDPDLHRLRDAGDVVALKALASDPEMTDLAKHRPDVELLWEVAQIPDFRKLSDSDHHGLMARIYRDLRSPGAAISEDLMTRQVKRLDNINGDIDTLAARIASIRVWTYISHRSRWLNNSEHWAAETRSVEDKLSDALHERLTQRFVDRRTAVLMRALKKRDDLSVSIDEESQKVAVEGHDIGELAGFTFKVEAGAARDDHKMLKAAADAALQGEILRRAKLYANIGVKTQEIDLSDGLASPKLYFEGTPFATITDPGAYLAPRVKLLETTLLKDEAAEIVRAAAQAWLDARVSEKLEPLLKLAAELNGDQDAPEGSVPLSGTVRGIAYRVMENYGVLKRADVADDLRQVDQEQRKALRRFGIRIGATSLYIPFVLKPHATEIRLMMWAMAQPEGTVLPALPTPGMVWCDRAADAPEAFYNLGGFVDCGPKAVRMDMFERLADAVRPLGQNGDWFEVTPEIMGLVGLSGDDFAAVMTTIGYGHETRQIAPAVVEAPQDEAGETPPDGSAAETAEAAKPVADSGAAPDRTETEDAVSGKSTAERPVAPAAPETEPAPEPATEPVTDPVTEPGAETELVERLFFRWTPKKRARPDRQGQGRRDRTKAGSGDRRGGKPRQDHSHRGGPGQDRPRPDKRAKGGKARPEKVADPDSPFAALAGLKDQLNRKS